MNTVTQADFESFIAQNCSISARTEPRKETDKGTGYLYECYDDADGNEIAFISWKNGIATYSIR